MQYLCLLAMTNINWRLNHKPSLPKIFDAIQPLIKINATHHNPRCFRLKRLHGEIESDPGQLAPVHYARLSESKFRPRSSTFSFRGVSRSILGVTCTDFDIPCGTRASTTGVGRLWGCVRRMICKQNGRKDPLRRRPQRDACRYDRGAHRPSMWDHHRQIVWATSGTCRSMTFWRWKLKHVVFSLFLQRWPSFLVPPCSCSCPNAASRPLVEESRRRRTVWMRYEWHISWW